MLSPIKYTLPNLFAKVLLNSSEYESVFDIIFIEPRKTFLATFRAVQLEATTTNNIPNGDLFNPRFDPIFCDQIQHRKTFFLAANMRSPQVTSVL